MTKTKPLVGYSEDISEFRFLNGKTVQSNAPLPISADELTSGNRALKAFLMLGSSSGGRRQSLHNLALLGRASLIPWAPAAFAFFLIGPTSTYKSTLLALFESAYDDEVKVSQLSSLSWSDSESSIERAQYLFNGMVLGIDDYAPDSNDRRMNGKAERFIRRCGNVKGVGRAIWVAERGIDVAESNTPRALCISTGEELPQMRGSNAARIVTNEIKPGDYTLKNIVAFYESGHAKNLHFGMMGYIKDLMNRAESEDITGEIVESEIYNLQVAFGSHSHSRLGRNAAELTLGLEYMLNYLVSVNELTEAQKSSIISEYLPSVGQYLRDTSNSGAEQTALDDKGRRLRRAVKAAIDSGRAYTLPRDAVLRASRNLYVGMEFIGYHDESAFYLIPEPTLKAARMYYPECASWTPNYFYRVLEESGLLIRNQNSDHRATQIKIDGKQIRAAHTPIVFDDTDDIPKPDSPPDSAPDSAPARESPGVIVIQRDDWKPRAEDNLINLERTGIVFESARSNIARRESSNKKPDAKKPDAKPYVDGYA